eukprot:1144125-Pelagomonas_calceolata.AAC.12
MLSLGYAHMFALLEQHIRLSILWLLNPVPHCYPGKHGAVHECGMASLLMLQLSCPRRQERKGIQSSSVQLLDLLKRAAPEA